MRKINEKTLRRIIKKQLFEIMANDYNTMPSSVSDIIDSILASKYIHIGELANMFSVPVSTISKWRNGKLTPSETDLGYLEDMWENVASEVRNEEDPHLY